MTDLTTFHAVYAVDGGHVYELLEDGCVGRDADATTNQDCHLEVIPVLMTSPEWTVNVDLGKLIVFFIYKHVSITERLVGNDSEKERENVPTNDVSHIQE